jgi:hypothetical protein
MAAETVVELYRTQERRERFEFNAAVTITYFGNTATLQGLSGRFSHACWSELQQYLLGRGIRQIQYFRRGKLKTIQQGKQL